MQLVLYDKNHDAVLLEAVLQMQLKYKWMLLIIFMGTTGVSLQTDELI